ncbi:sensor histidine kinase [Haliscomenobacter sp.]|uniref:sensor histidine kinase n=1 Tax=Haliscomenobacter sp. TaxID=2717303 RepID=UPI003BA8F516
MKNLYQNLSRVPFLAKSYSRKFLFIAFLGIHIPLIGLIGFAVFRSDIFTPVISVIVAFVFTLLGVLLTLFILHGLLSPLRQAEQALRQYLSTRSLPNLPMHYQDEVGSLFNNLQNTLERLELLLRQREDLTALLSHDLRTPLAQTIGVCQTIKQETDPKVINEFCDELSAEMEKQLAFLDEVLNLFRQEDLVLTKTDFEKVSVKNLVDGVLQSIESVIKNKHIQVTQQIVNDVRIGVKPELFKQAIQNLILNAVKFSETKGTVQVSCFENDQNQVCIQVRDQGIGFEPDISMQLFEKFTKSGKKGTMGEKSTGIGLYLAKGIVEKHRGRIEASSQGLGKGAVFSIYLPNVG